MRTWRNPASSACFAFCTRSRGDCSSDESQYPMCMPAAYRAGALVNSAPMTERHIVGLGGGGDTQEQTDRLYDYVLGITGKSQPRLLYVPTAIAESADGIVSFYERLRGRAERSHLRTFPWPPPDLRQLILEQDAICVSGGNTANMLAIWRAHGIDRLL